MSDDLWRIARESNEDDPFLEFDIARASHMATEKDAYDELCLHVSSSLARTIADKLPYLRRRAPSAIKHCDCDPQWLVWDYDEAICSSCGIARVHVGYDVERLAYDEWRPPPRKYERTTRFRIIVDRFREGCSARVSDDQLDRIKSAMSVTPEDATATDVRRAIRKLRMPKLYRSVPGIVAQLRDTCGLIIDSYDVIILKRMFQAMMMRMPHTGRVYMPSYNMILATFLQILGYEQVSIYVPQLSHKRTYTRVSAICRSIDTVVRGS